MAENEILDVGNLRHYRRWHKALADPNLSPAEVAECLSEDFLAVFRKKLRGKPLYLILKASAHDRKTLLEAIVNSTERAMAKFVEQACTITRSSDPLVVAHKIAELMIDGAMDRANRFAFQHAHNADSIRHAALERAASARLEACKVEIVGLLTASLRNEPIRRMPRVAKARPTAEVLVSTSLLRPASERPGESPRV